MAFTGNYMCTSFKVALLNGEMDFSSDTSQSFKIALYTSDATLNAETTAYSTTNEVSGTGYTAGGNTLTIATNPTNDTSSTVAYLDFSDTTWASSSITARGALIYKAGGTTPIQKFTKKKNGQPKPVGFLINPLKKNLKNKAS